tara:strand:+ start:937 stop:1116 length:180 start_codon:yes stop_codon:yes gene_type:complete
MEYIDGALLGVSTGACIDYIVGSTALIVICEVFIGDCVDESFNNTAVNICRPIPVNVCE